MKNKKNRLTDSGINPLIPSIIGLVQMSVRLVSLRIFNI